MTEPASTVRGLFGILAEGLTAMFYGAAEYHATRIGYSSPDGVGELHTFATTDDQLAARFREVAEQYARERGRGIEHHGARAASDADRIRKAADGYARERDAEHGDGGAT